jgi:hypothetical protein
MEKKELSLIILGIVAVIAVVGLVMLFKSAMSGAYTYAPYPPAYSYANTQEDPWPYATGTYKGGVPEKPAYLEGVETWPGIQVEPGRVVYGTGEGLVYRDWNRRREPERTAVAWRDQCDALARLGEVPQDHTWEASLTQINREGSAMGRSCVVNPRNDQPGGSAIAYCCQPPGA